MLKQLQDKLKEEQTQRAILNATGLVATFIATKVFASYMDKGVNLGIDKLMEKLHPTEVTAE